MNHELRALPAPIRANARHLFSYDAGYSQGQADASAKFSLECEAMAARNLAWVTWGMVLAFLIGGLFGVAVCVYMWPAVAAGVLP